MFLQIGDTILSNASNSGFVYFANSRYGCLETVAHKYEMHISTK